MHYCSPAAVAVMAVAVVVSSSVSLVSDGHCRFVVTFIES